MDASTWGEAFLKGGAILSPNPTANFASVAEEEDEACVTTIQKSTRLKSFSLWGLFCFA
ncbi:hypothetical protein J7E38_09045 [Bacillus sp. ISL-35]|nr:hypothetical protein [Bacillus sp. ISL-35]MBT2702768.1 hypothetical protein [Chryseobacterium sp. ISL-80]